MAPTTVAIIGAGIAGPVLAMLLKMKGYDPVLYERTENVSMAGLSLALQPNGIKVLRHIPGLLEKLPGQHISHSGVFSTLSDRTLVLHDGPSQAGRRYGSSDGSEFGMFGIERGSFQRALTEQALERGVPIHWGHHLERIEQDEENQKVRLTFANKVTTEASFVVGCDGLHSNTRTQLFGDEIKADYTGLVQTGGVSPRPSALNNQNVFCNFVGSGAHMVSYPVSATHYSWAISHPEEEHKESWRSIDDHIKEEFKRGPFSSWGCGAGELVRTSEKIIKYGLYDRPAIENWFCGRGVLLGDAAHPTTPHLGQGANQAFEDVYHLVLALQTHHPDPSVAPSTDALTAAFSAYQTVRRPRSAALVERARERGNKRVAVASGDEAAHKREELWTSAFSLENFWLDMDVYAKGPYDGQTQIIFKG